MRRSKVDKTGIYGGVANSQVIFPPRAVSVAQMTKEDGDRIEDFNRNTRQVQDIERKLTRKHTREEQVSRDEYAALIRNRESRDRQTNRGGRQRFDTFSLGRVTPKQEEIAGPVAENLPQANMQSADAVEQTESSKEIVLQRYEGQTEGGVIQEMIKAVVQPEASIEVPLQNVPARLHRSARVLTLDEYRVSQGLEPIMSTLETRTKRNKYGVKMVQRDTIPGM